MRHLRQICGGFLLAVALSVSASAGEIPSPGATDGPQESPGVTGPQESPGVAGPQESPGAAGEIPAPGIMGDILAPGVSLVISLLF